MAEIRTSFAILEDASTQAGLPLHKVLAGDASASKNALAALSAVDPSGNLQYLKLTAAGLLKVDTEGVDVAILSDEGSNTGGSLTFVDLASITLTASKSYRNPDVSVSCSRESIFQLVQVDDATTNIIAIFRVGAGHYSFAHKFAKRFTAGATGTQTLKIQGKNSLVASEMNSALGVEEEQ